MKYLSTRGDATPRAFCEILLEGLAPDGGLYLPQSYPHIDAATLARWRKLSYAELAFEMPAISRDMIVVIQALVILFTGALENLVRMPVERAFLRLRRRAA